MRDSICDAVLEDHLVSVDPIEEGGIPDLNRFRNSDEFLRKVTPEIVEERKAYGLEGIVKGLDSVVINTSPEHLLPAVSELLGNTGLHCRAAYENDHFRTYVLGVEGSADLLIRSRLRGKNPFLEFNNNPKSGHVPQSRLETFTFLSSDIDRYFEVQTERGVRFMTDEIVRGDNYSFIQTVPSRYTGNSIGIIQWHQNRGELISEGDTIIDEVPQKPDWPHLLDISYLDHCATRVEAKDRDPAILEFMEVTNYDFDFAIYVRMMNSITNVARVSRDDFAMVFTSGISPFRSIERSGPTEKFIHNYGRRVHHMAFQTENIENTFYGLKEHGQGFLLDLVGSPEDGLKQTFTTQSATTLLVNEYIHRYGDFDGFFTKSNVTSLTEATGKQ